MKPKQMKGKQNKEKGSDRNINKELEAWTELQAMKGIEESLSGQFPTFESDAAIDKALARKRSRATA